LDFTRQLGFTNCGRPAMGFARGHSADWRL
jgi:hypothetical protein